MSVLSLQLVFLSGLMGSPKPTKHRYRMGVEVEKSTYMHAGI